MANRFSSPDQQFADGTGLPYAGGTLSFYASGTSTPLNTYSDSALSVPNTNPIVLDSSGRAGSIFLQNLSYKVVLADVNANQIWTEDPVYSSDYSTAGQFITFAGNPNTNVAGTAGSGSIPSSVVWDRTNNVLYVCTTTGNAASAVWTAVNPSLSNVTATPPPAGRLTAQSGTPVMNADVLGAGTVIYTPYLDNTVPLYNGTAMVPTVFTELSLTLSSSNAANNIYDVFIFSNSGTLTLASGPAWSNVTPGSCARGTGAGTTQLAFLNGHLVNALSMTGRNGANSYTIGANLGTYLGSIYIDATAGQTTCHYSWGQNRKVGIWNAFNRVPIVLKAGDSTATWTYATNTYRASNNVPAAYSATEFNVGSGTACNGLTVFQGLAEEEAVISFKQYNNDGGGTSGTGNVTTTTGIGINSVTGITGMQGQSFSDAGNYMSSNTGGGGAATLVAEYLMPPTLGLTNVVAMEKTNSGGQNVTFSGTEGFMVLSAWWRG